MSDAVNHPSHYDSHPSGVECIDVVEHMGFNIGNAVKYLWRCDLKRDAIEDLRKAAWYVNREIEKRIKDAEQQVQEEEERQYERNREPGSAHRRITNTGERLDAGFS